MNGRAVSARTWESYVSAGAGVLFFALSLGCIPVATMSGRPAAVLPRYESRAGLAVGGFSYDQEVPSGTESMGWPHIYVHGSGGLGGRTDLRLGGMVAVGEESAIGAQLWLDARLQLVGRPYAGYPGHSRAFPLDISLEAGAGAQAGILGVFSDRYAGANVSVPLSGATPYFTYRRHRGRFNTSGLGNRGDFRQRSYIAGVEFASAKQPFAIEVFHCKPVAPCTVEVEGAWTVWGVSVIFYMSTDAAAPAGEPVEPLPPGGEPIPAP